MPEISECSRCGQLEFVDLGDAGLCSDCLAFDREQQWPLWSPEQEAQPWQ